MKRWRENKRPSQQEDILTDCATMTGNACCLRDIVSHEDWETFIDFMNRLAFLSWPKICKKIVLFAASK